MIDADPSARISTLHERVKAAHSRYERIEAQRETQTKLATSGSAG
jgi:hypothetical protein